MEKARSVPRQVQGSLYETLFDHRSLGAILHVNAKGSIWIQETYNTVVTVPWYTTTSVGYTWSW